MAKFNVGDTVTLNFDAATESSYPTYRGMNGKSAVILEITDDYGDVDTEYYVEVDGQKFLVDERYLAVEIEITNAAVDTLVSWYELEYNLRPQRVNRIDAQIWRNELEQREEEKRLKAEYASSRKSELRVKPETFMVVNNSAASIEISLLCPYLNKRQDFQIVFNGGDADTLRTELTQNTHAELAAANANPYQFWMK